MGVIGVDLLFVDLNNVSLLKRNKVGTVIVQIRNHYQV